MTPLTREELERWHGPSEAAIVRTLSLTALAYLDRAERAEQDAARLREALEELADSWASFDSSPETDAKVKASLTPEAQP